MRRWMIYWVVMGAFMICLYRCWHILNDAPETKVEPKLFMIGASTVRYDYDDQRMGWGDALIQEYMKDPENGFNEARRGATAEGYRQMNASIKKHKGAAYWARTKAMMQAKETPKGSYLLIQFGGNDKIKKVPKEAFQQTLKGYLREAQAMGMIPVLISPVETRLKRKGGKAYHSRGAYPDYVRELAYQERVLFLDLNGKSYKHYKALSQEVLDARFGAVVYPNGRIDRTHFTPQGAKIVAGWIRELACQKDEKLCAVFK